eukprot:TRINITY_DN10978_c0_g1_i2.p1 TRINITY_DN10978_c0_g1~~TRINITY_DN10978_c0_g1_i2.p1  ORF type:complete len:603 (+),score=146.94 TRINITY_DN10978_c0_g1_i2:159-1967(+)
MTDQDDDSHDGETRHMALPVGVDVTGSLDIELEFPIDTTRVLVPVSITPDNSVADVTRRTADTHHLPEYLESAVYSSLKLQTDVYRQQLRDQRDDALCSSGTEQIDKWVRACTQERHDYVMHARAASERVSTSSAFVQELANEAPFSEVFHDAIHSPLLHSLLQMEESLAEDMKEALAKKQKALERFEVRQMEEMNECMSQLGQGLTDSDINRITLRQVEQRESQIASLDSELNAHKTDQKLGYQDYVRTLWQDMKNGKLPEPTAAFPHVPSPQMPRRTSPSPSSEADSSIFKSVFKMGRNVGKALKQASQGNLDVVSTLNPRQQEEATSTFEPSGAEPARVESFTVALGTQMKLIHNLRLMRGNIINLCADGSNLPEEERKAKRLAIAMSLYSNSLNAMVITVDKKLSSYTGTKKEFAAVCEKATDLHFPELPEQLEQLQVDLGDSNEEASLKPGDCYITRHSNLTDVHVVFHLVVDAQVNSDRLNTQSRMMTGLRNIVRCVFQNNINTVTIPLLLVHEQPEGVDRRWCEKRCELLLKTLKGYIMENTAWGRAESKTIQLVVPRVNTARPKQTTLFSTHTRTWSRKYSGKPEPCSSCNMRC